MKPFKDYETTKAYGSREQLPKGGYIMQILNIGEKTNRNGFNYFEISADIAEGEYKDFFRRDYNSQNGEDKKWKGCFYLTIPTDDGTEADDYRKRSFKTFTEALEDSNTGYAWDWDETKWKGKYIGGLFSLREWEFNGRTGWSTSWRGVCPCDDIREGDYKLPQDRPLRNRPAPTPSVRSDSFMQIPEGIDADLPFT